METITPEHAQALGVLLNMMIPPSSDGAIPGAAQLNFLDYVNTQNLMNTLMPALQILQQESLLQYEKPFGQLADNQQTQLVQRARVKHFRPFATLTSCVVQFYYQQDPVLRAIGVPLRPPFPQGYVVESGDLCLLEPVYDRGQMYRDAD